MAIQTRTYRFMGISPSDLALRISPAASIDPEFESYVKLTWDDAIATQAAVDEAAEQHGLVPTAGLNGGILPVNYIDGMRCNPRFGADSAQIEPGICRSDDDSWDIVLPVTGTVDITVVGPNGRDAISPNSPSTWYAIWVIADTTGANPVALLLSTSFTAPTLPAGYNKKRRVGCTYNDSGGNFRRGKQVWNGRTRRYYWDNAPGGLQALTNGSGSVFTTLDLAAFVPPSALNTMLRVGFQSGAGGAASDGLSIQADLLAAASAPQFFSPGSILTSKAQWTTEVNVTAQKIDYGVTSPANNTADVFVLGFDDEI